MRAQNASIHHISKITTYQSKYLCTYLDNSILLMKKKARNKTSVCGWQERNSPRDDTFYQYQITLIICTPCWHKFEIYLYFLPFQWCNSHVFSYVISHDWIETTKHVCMKLFKCSWFESFVSIWFDDLILVRSI